PENLRVDSVAFTEVILSWDAMTVTDTFQIFRDGRLIAFAHKGTTFTDSGLMQDTTYQYTVAAIDGKGRPYPSTKIQVTTLPNVSTSDVNVFTTQVNVNSDGGEISLFDADYSVISNDGKRVVLYEYPSGDIFVHHLIHGTTKRVSRWGEDPVI